MSVSVHSLTYPLVFFLYQKSFTNNLTQQYVTSVNCLTQKKLIILRINSVVQKTSLVPSPNLFHMLNTFKYKYFLKIISSSLIALLLFTISDKYVSTKDKNSLYSTAVNFTKCPRPKIGRVSHLHFNLCCGKRDPFKFYVPFL